MSYEKHYDANYLDRTAEGLKQIKLSSYTSLKGCNTIVDLGCGTGVDVFGMNSLFSESKIIGVDHDPNLIALAKETAVNNEAEDVEFFVGDAENLDMFKNQTVDGVRLERVYQHLKKPDKVTDEIRRILTEGGRISALETDWCGINVFTPNIGLQRKLADYLTHEKVYNGIASRSIYDLFLEKGFRNVRQKVVSFVIDNYSMANSVIKIDQMIDEMSSAKIIKDSQADQFKVTLQQRQNSDSFAIGISMIQITAEK
jgi:ubiquinone/menaquinone biosynthesis C-methylase UbiE